MFISHILAVPQCMSCAQFVSMKVFAPGWPIIWTGWRGWWATILKWRSSNLSLRPNINKGSSIFYDFVEENTSDWCKKNNRSIYCINKGKKAAKKVHFNWYLRMNLVTFPLFSSLWKTSLHPCPIVPPCQPARWRPSSEKFTFKDLYTHGCTSFTRFTSFTSSSNFTRFTCFNNITHVGAYPPP